MKDQVVEVKAKMLLRDCPEFIDRYIVLKNDGDSHYFFGHYRNRIDAENVAKQIKGEVVEKIQPEGGL